MLEKQCVFKPLVSQIFCRMSLHLALSHACESVSCSVMSNFLQPYGLQPARLLCPWNSPGKNIGVGSHSLLQGIFPAEGLNPGLLHCKWFFLPFEPPGEPKNTIPSPVDLPDPGIELGSPALPADSLPTELSGTLVGPRTALNF